MPTPITISQDPNPLRGQRETRPCAVCGAPVTRYLSQQRAVQDWTCSRTCNGKINQQRRLVAGTWPVGQKKRRGETVPCEHCGAPVYRNVSQAAKGEGRYCSQVCKYAAETKTPVVKVCANCGKELRLKPSQAARQYCSRYCMSLGVTKRPGDRMYNGKPIRFDPAGYVLVWEPTHPNRSQKGWQYEHRLVAERALGRYLRSDEAVHHENHVKDDNRPENLTVMDGNEHAVLSVREYREELERRLARLAAYERLHGPLSGEEP